MKKKELRKIDTYESAKMFLRNGIWKGRGCHACYFWKEDGTDLMKSRIVARNKRLALLDDCSKPMVGDGLILFRQFLFGMDSPMAHRGIVDTHVLGKDLSLGLDAPFHFVVGPHLANYFYEAGAVPKKLPNFGEEEGHIKRFHVEKMIIQDETYLKEGVEDIRVDTIQVTVADEYPEMNRGDSDMPADEFSQHYVLDENDRASMES